MRWSFKIGRIAGIDIKVHATFLLLLAFFGWGSYARRHSLADATLGIGFILALFLCVVLHELGHALTARRYGIRTRDIVLLPIGGVARLERIPEDPTKELLVAVAGPAVNVVIAAALFAFLTVSGNWHGLRSLSATELEGVFVEQILRVNIFMVLFNLLPAFPMDGGRMLRAVLAMVMEYSRATRLAAAIGQGMALLIGFVGITRQPAQLMLVVIAVFVWIGAGQESSFVQMKAALGGVPVRRLMVTQFRTLLPTDTLDHAIELTLATTQRDFPVVEGDRVVGLLTQQALIRALSAGGRDTPVTNVMERSFQTVETSEPIESAFMRLQTNNTSTLPVTDAGRLVGLLTIENVGEFLSIQSALKS